MIDLVIDDGCALVVRLAENRATLNLLAPSTTDQAAPSDRAPHTD